MSTLNIPTAPVTSRGQGRIPASRDYSTSTLLLTLDEVADELRCTRRSVERQIAADRLVALHIGRAVRVERSELESFLTRLRDLAIATDAEPGTAP